MSDIAEEKVDVICVTVGTTLQHSGAVWNALTRAGGAKAYKLEAKYVFLVVHPDIHHLEDAYRNVFREAMARGCASVAIPGLGCGLIGNSAHASCMKACEVLHQIANESLGSIQLIVFADIKERVAEQFDIQLEAKFGTTVNGEGTDQARSSFETFTKIPAEVYEDDCAICLCPLTESSEVRELPCKHQLHNPCLKGYLESPNAKKRCPVCLRYFQLPLGDQPAEAQMLINKLTHVKLPELSNNPAQEILEDIPESSVIVEIIP
ncbi:zinc finger, C3HC4 type [Oesophagostomum dentatum]|uniref:E3 ubiquitin-protein ligase n=1 Tax=Oesophagostomum dentatum TaxID=61180 RepID=A0A0B1TUY5_OESDE|nr:zinc finger, C3HC4 type [Oesophagostomum dentatum]